MAEQRSVVAEGAGDDDVVAASANCLVVAEISGAHQRLTDMQQLTVPPHLFSRSSPAHPCPKPLNQLLAIHAQSDAVPDFDMAVEAQGVPCFATELLLSPERACDVGTTTLQASRNIAVANSRGLVRVV